MRPNRKHIRKFHCQSEVRFECIRCHRLFTKHQDLSVHLRQEGGNLCQLADPVVSSLWVDGKLSQEVTKKLCARGSEQLGWNDLWQLIFPEDSQNIPPPGT